MSLAVLTLGDPRLRRVAAPVDLMDPSLPEDLARLHAALAEFRAAHGFGRAIAAPQLAIPRRAIALDLGEGPFTALNPEVLWRSAETFTMWDDCMCFPELLVRVRRARSISARWLDPEGREHVRVRLPLPLSELLQHEIDHLDGVLAVDRAEGDPATVSRDEYRREPGRFAAMVDHVYQVA